MYSPRRNLLGLLLVISNLYPGASAQVDLGTATPYGVIAATAITNTGATVINGLLGIFPDDASSITGFPPGKSNGINAGNAAADQARTDAGLAYSAAASQVSTAAITSDLGGRILTPGVYTASSSAGLTGALILDGQNNANSVFVFQIGSTLTTATASSVVLINGAQACNVFWQVGSSATLGAATVFAGNILALASISLDAGVTVNGGLYALNGAVTLIQDLVTPQQSCIVVVSSSSVSAHSSASLDSLSQMAVVTASSSLVLPPSSKLPPSLSSELIQLSSLLIPPSTSSPMFSPAPSLVSSPSLSQVSFLLFSLFSSPVTNSISSLGFSLTTSTIFLTASSISSTASSISSTASLTASLTASVTTSSTFSMISPTSSMIFSTISLASSLTTSFVTSPTTSPSTTAASSYRYPYFYPKPYPRPWYHPEPKLKPKPWIPSEPKKHAPKFQSPVGNKEGYGGGKQLSGGWGGRQGGRGNIGRGRDSSNILKARTLLL